MIMISNFLFSFTNFCAIICFFFFFTKLLIFGILFSRSDFIAFNAAFLAKPLILGQIIFIIKIIVYYKTFFRPIWSVSFSKNVFVFLNSYMITNFKFRIFIINFITRANICFIFNINMFHLNCSMISILVFIYYII